VPRIDQTWWTSGSYRGRPVPEILAARDFGALFAFLRSRGWSVGGLSAATQLDEYPIREIMKGRREVTKYEVIERIVLGLEIERHMCGIGASPSVPTDSGTSAPALTDWLSRAQALDDAGFRLLEDENDRLRRVDRLLGASAADRQLAGHMETLTSLHDFSLRPASRERLSDLVCDAAALAGWVALDLGDVERAWRYHEAAKVAGYETGSTATLGHALAQQAYVLIEIGQIEDARALAEYAIVVSGQGVPPVLASWLSAVAGELAAVDGDATASHAHFDRAARLLPTDAADPAAPYIMLDEFHLARWQGTAAARLGDSDAINALEYALSGMDSTFIRARAQLHVELAYSLLAADRCYDASVQAESAHALAGRAGSLRQRRRVQRLKSVLAQAA
jgi:hypothetical protein